MVHRKVIRQFFPGTQQIGLERIHDHLKIWSQWSKTCCKQKINRLHSELQTNRGQNGVVTNIIDKISMHWVIDRLHELRLLHPRKAISEGRRQATKILFGSSSKRQHDCLRIQPQMSEHKQWIETYATDLLSTVAAKDRLQKRLMRMSTFRTLSLDSEQTQMWPRLCYTPIEQCITGEYRTNIKVSRVLEA